MIDEIPSQTGFIFEIILWVFIISGILLSLILAKNKRWILCFLFLFSTSCIVWGRFVEIYRLKVIEHQTEVLGDEKIVLVADFHLRKTKDQKWVTKVVAKIKEQDSTMVLIAGDFLTDDSVTYADDFEPFKTLNVPIYYVLGNHDYKINSTMPPDRAERLRENLNKFGLIELQNQVIETENLILLGVEDNYLGFDDLPKVLSDLKQNEEKIADKPKILLAHSPDIVDDSLTAEIDPDFIFSGHTHCGQIRMPFVGSLPKTIPTANGPNYSRHYYPDKKIFITCGVGETGPAARFLNPPEIVVFGDFEGLSEK